MALSLLFVFVTPAGISLPPFPSFYYFHFAYSLSFICIFSHVFFIPSKDKKKIIEKIYITICYGSTTSGSVSSTTMRVADELGEDAKEDTNDESDEEAEASSVSISIIVAVNGPLKGVDPELPAPSERDRTKGGAEEVGETEAVANVSLGVLEL